MRRLVGILVLAAVLASCDPSGTGSPGPKSWTIKYEATGTASSLNIIYADSVYINNSLTTAPPWSYQFTATSGQWVYLQVQNTGSGSMTLAIYKNGSLIDTSTYSVPGIAWLDEGFLQ